MRAPYGQNFLVSPGTARRIVDALGAGPADAVIEIGPGRGALTDSLEGRGASLTLVELDRALAAGLAARWSGDPRVRVVQADFLDWPLPEGRHLVIGNLPYSAAAAIVQKVLAWGGWSRAVFMVQREVAERMTATPGGKHWGLLGLSVQSRARGERLFHVPPGAFQPRPSVQSTVIRLERQAAPVVRDLDSFFRVAHAAFGQRRKTILNSLSHGLALDKETVSAALAHSGIAPSRRPETLTLEDFDRLTQSFPQNLLRPNCL